MWCKSSCQKWLVAVAILFVQHAVLAQEISGNDNGSGKHVFGTELPAGYVARQENLRSFFGAVSAHLGKSIIVSKLAAGKQISGNFDLSIGDIVSKVSRQLGLVTYYDGNAIYIYDASETKNSVIKLKNASPKVLTQFLKKSGLADPRYPLRGDGVDTFYLSGPPIYIDLVTQAAQFMDSQDAGMGNQHVEVIKLNNTFVTDRAYTRRDENIVIPGIATIIEKLLSGDQRQAVPMLLKNSAEPPFLDAAIDRLNEADANDLSRKKTDNKIRSQASSNIRVIAYPETNSLLVKGTV